MEQNIADGIVEDVLDRNGEESSKSCGVVGVLLTFFKELQCKGKREERKKKKQFLHKGKSVLCACTVTVRYVVCEYLNIMT